jgi:hypothetical protein
MLSKVGKYICKAAKNVNGDERSRDMVKETFFVVTVH